MSSRTIAIAGAGIGGLTAALTLAAKGFRVVVFEQAAKLEETGAGIQLSPNATRVLQALGLTERLLPHVIAPQEVRIMLARYEKPLARIPLGDHAARRYGAPYWVIHRAALQRVLADAAMAHPDITLRLGTQVADFATYADGITVAALHGAQAIDEQAIALIGADGLRSRIRDRLHGGEPHFAHRTAWRALIPAADVRPEFREPHVYLWLGSDAHLVHYPVENGRMINIVAIVRSQVVLDTWSHTGPREDLLAAFTRLTWSRAARELVETPQNWLVWSLYDRSALTTWGRDRVTLLGDAAHPMLPFLAQGGAMAIEDAASLALHLAHRPDEPARALRLYERARRKRTARAQRASRRNSRIYQMAGIEAFARNAALRLLSGNRLLARFDWLYDWKAQ